MGLCVLLAKGTGEGRRGGGYPGWAYVCATRQVKYCDPNSSREPREQKKTKENKVSCLTVTVGRGGGFEGVDVLAKAKTGTGKTLAFLIPAIENAVEAARAADGGQAKRFAKGSISAIIISPTRELAQQIAVEAQQVGPPESIARMTTAERNTMTGRSDGMIWQPESASPCGGRHHIKFDLPELTRATTWYCRSQDKLLDSEYRTSKETHPTQLMCHYVEFAGGGNDIATKHDRPVAVKHPEP